MGNSGDHGRQIGVNVVEMNHIGPHAVDYGRKTGLDIANAQYTPRCRKQMCITAEEFHLGSEEAAPSRRFV